MDENTGTTANDSSAFANTGTFSSAAWATGRNGYAGSFNGTSSVVDMGKGITASANSFSVACWVRMSSTGGYQTFISQDGVNISGFLSPEEGRYGEVRLFDFYLGCSGRRCHRIVSDNTSRGDLGSPAGRL